MPSDAKMILDPPISGLRIGDNINTGYSTYEITAVLDDGRLEIAKWPRWKHLIWPLRQFAIRQWCHAFGPIWHDGKPR